jgi:hypothetical protein
MWIPLEVQKKVGWSKALAKIDLSRKLKNVVSLFY